MCGIVGMVATFENGFTFKHKDVFSNLLWLDTLRGDDSTGIFGVNKYGNVKYAKDIKNGPQSLETTECKDILSDIYLNGRCIVGHNRKATRGFITDENAHPFVEGDKILVHNGTLANHKELTENKVEVDSHAILHSIVERGYQKTFEEIQGAFALAWYDTKEKKLHLARNSERPLWIANTPGAWIFASEKEMLEFVLERNKIEVKDYTELTPGTVYSIEMGLGKSPDKLHGGYLFDEEWGDENWKEFDSFCVKALLYYLHNGLVNTGIGDKYHLNKLNASVGSGNLVSTLHRFLESNVGKETYSHYVDGMNDDEKDRCLRDFVEDHLNGETYTPQQITNGLHLVAKHFSYNINVGMKDRPQKRFGADRKGVNLYVITDSRNPFNKPSVDVVEPQFPVSDEVLELFSGLSK